MRAVQIRTFGEPGIVLELADLPEPPAPAAGQFALPEADPRQVAMLGINPPTAALLLNESIDLRPGDWVAQNAANSGVGRSLIAIAKARGLKTINFVRRPELVPELQAV